MRNISYLTDFYDDKIKKINDIDAPLNFVFITDEHNRLNEIERNGETELTVDAIESIRHIIERCPKISMVVNGGDIVNDYFDTPEKVRESVREPMEAFYSLSVPVYSCIGNHDDALSTAVQKGRDTTQFTLLPDELHRYMMKYNPTKENYYYIDSQNTHYRFVFLNTSDWRYDKDENGQYYTPNYRTAISVDQINWFLNEASKTDRKIIVFSHAPLCNKGMVGSGGPKLILPYDETWNGAEMYYHIKNNDNVVAVFSGHVHFDNIVYDDYLLQVTTLSSFPSRYASKFEPERKLHTITETAFDVVSIKDDVVHITRFGAGYDRIGCILR